MMSKRRRASTTPLALIGLGLLLILGAAGWYGFAFLRPEAEPQTIQPVEGGHPDIPRVSLGDAKAALDTGSAVFVDVRDAESYSQSHIRGAISIPVGELPDRMQELNPKDWIITYCT